MRGALEASTEGPVVRQRLMVKILIVDDSQTIRQQGAIGGLDVLERLRADPCPLSIDTGEVILF